MDSISIKSNHVSLSTSSTKTLSSRSPSKGSLAAQFPSIVNFLQKTNFGNNWNTSIPNETENDSNSSVKIGVDSTPSSSSSFFDEKCRFALPEIYFMYDSIDENVYEYRKKLEASQNVNKWVSIVFGRDKRIITEKIFQHFLICFYFQRFHWSYQLSLIAKMLIQKV